MNKVENHVNRAINSPIEFLKMNFMYSLQTHI